MFSNLREYLVPKGVIVVRMEYNEPQNPILELSGRITFGHVLSGIYSFVSRKRSILQWVQLSRMFLPPMELYSLTTKAEQMQQGDKEFLQSR